MRIRVSIGFIIIMNLILSSCGSNSNDEKVSNDSNNVNVSSNASTEVSIGKQIWMSQNLNTDKFRNGDVIKEAKSDDEWKNACDNQQPAWCYYNNNSDNGDRLGKLYNWYAIIDSRGLAPAGWHTPTNDEWSRLADFLGGWKAAGHKLKSKDFWSDEGWGSNESGFNAMPGGYRNEKGKFVKMSTQGTWWCFSVSDTSQRIGRYIVGDEEFIKLNNRSKGDGLSVRCVKD